MLVTLGVFFCLSEAHIGIIKAALELGAGGYGNPEKQARTVVSPDPGGIPPKTPSGCLELWIVPNSLVHTYDKFYKLGTIRD